jgi:hypothetical protein
MQLLEIFNTFRQTDKKNITGQVQVLQIGKGTTDIVNDDSGTEWLMFQSAIPFPKDITNDSS